MGGSDLGIKFLNTAQRLLEGLVGALRFRCIVRISILIEQFGRQTDLFDGGLKRFSIFRFQIARLF